MFDKTPLLDKEKVFTSDNISELVSFLPPGWQEESAFVRIILGAMQLTGETEITVRIRRGLLKVEGTNEYFNRIMQTVTLDSVHRCMICGAKSKRWKKIRGQFVPNNPSLCFTHFLEYMDFISHERKTVDQI